MFCLSPPCSRKIRRVVNSCNAVSPPFKPILPRIPTCTPTPKTIHGPKSHMTPFDSHAYTEAYVSFTADTLADYIPNTRSYHFWLSRSPPRSCFPVDGISRGNRNVWRRKTAFLLQTKPLRLRTVEKPSL